MKCLIYNERPELCKKFPSHESHIYFFKSCSYTFTENGERIGECNQCGECCFLRADLHKFGDKFSPGAPCPYLDSQS